MPAAELAEWVAFEREFGPITLHERIDAAAAVIALHIHNSVPRRHGKEYGVSDFLPKWGIQESVRQQSPEEMMAIASALVNRKLGRRGN